MHSFIQVTKMLVLIWSVFDQVFQYISYLSLQRAKEDQLVFWRSLGF